jgi:hypothetical protein
MAGQSALWQVQDSAANGTEATATSTNTILFNETPVVTSGGNIFATDFNIRRAIGENTNVDGNGNELQDMRLSGIEIQVTGIIKDADSGNAIIGKLMTWLKEDQDATGYEEGRFGLRLDDFPHFNMIPTSTYGIMIRNLRFARDPSKNNKAGFILTLAIGGNLTSWIASNGF